MKLEVFPTNSANSLCEIVMGACDAVVDHRIIKSEFHLLVKDSGPLNLSRRFPTAHELMDESQTDARN